MKGVSTMSLLINKRVIIINKTVNFNCFLGAARGSITGEIYDQGSDVFPAHITVDSNLGAGSFELNLQGNQVIKEDVQGVKIEVTVSEWEATENILRFHLKAVATKKIVFPVSCTVIDTTFSGARHNSEAFTFLLSSFNKKLEALSEQSGF
jgi:hypothetical protein